MNSQENKSRFGLPILTVQVCLAFYADCISIVKPKDNSKSENESC